MDKSQPTSWLERVVGDAELLKETCQKNFNKDARRVLNEGVLKVALGFHIGSTMYEVLRYHKLVTKNKTLTKKGFRYSRALYLEGTLHFDK